MSYKNILLEKKAKVAKIIINRPEVLNALNRETRFEILGAFLELERDENINVIIITGSGDKAFSAGQDLNESVDFKEEGAKVWIEEHDRLYKGVINSTKAIIASLRGYSVGAGFQLALLADIRICSENAKFAFTEINVGIPTVTGTGTLWHLTNLANIKELVLTGDFIDANRAKEMSLVNRVVPDDELEKVVNEFAEKISKKPRTALMLNKKLFAKLTSSFFDDIFEEAARSHSMAFASGEPEKLMKKFLKKRD
jgi:enoyl-CoA hydratase/carnithine racemase